MNNVTSAQANSLYNEFGNYHYCHVPMGQSFKEVFVFNERVVGQMYVLAETRFSLKTVFPSLIFIMGIHTGKTASLH